MIPLSFLLLAAFVLSAQQPAPTAAETRGIVVDARGGEALANVIVQLPGTAFRATADSAGHFRISAIPPGDYTLNVSTVGYHLVKRPFHLDPARHPGPSC